jgi:putative peptide zinc metalloprotease protein
MPTNFTIPLKLADGITILPFDTSSTEPQYLVCTPEGAKLQVSAAIHFLLNLMDGQHSMEQVTGAFSNYMGRVYHQTEIEQILEEYLVPYNLIAGRKSERKRSNNTSIHFKIVLLPAHWALCIADNLRFLFDWRLATYFLTCIVIVHVFVYGPFAFMVRPIAVVNFTTPGLADNLIVIALILLSNLWHELGHATACRLYGVRNGHIGFGFYLFFPVFYTDVSEAWHLPRLQRAVVDVAGIYFQLIFSTGLYILYLITGNLVFLLAFIGIAAILLFTLIPFFKFDGYWLVSDLIGVPNLRQRSQSLLKLGLVKLWQRINGIKRAVKLDSADLPFLQQIRPLERGLLVAYALFTVTYVTFFLTRVGWLLFPFITAYPAQLHQVLSDMGKANYAPLTVLNGFGELAFPSLLFLGVLFFLYRVSRLIGQGIFSLIRTLK